MSPADVGQDAFVTQVASADMFLQQCRAMIESFDVRMQNSAPEVQGTIREVLAELVEKVKEGERVQAMGEVSLEAAASLFETLK